jgi:hypothetical protein
LEDIDEEARGRRIYDRLMVIKALVRLAQKFGRAPERSEVRTHTDFTATTVGNRLGSWEDAAEYVRTIADVDSETDSTKPMATPRLRHSGEDIGIERRLDNLDIFGDLQNELSDE